jgi:hypothetical protein
MKLSDGSTVQVPRGFYQATDVQTEVDNTMQLPNVADPMSLFQRTIGGKTVERTRTANTNGLYVPMPFGIQPINIQVLALQNKYVIIFSCFMKIWMALDLLAVWAVK